MLYFPKLKISNIQDGYQEQKLKIEAKTKTEFTDFDIFLDEY